MGREENNTFKGWDFSYLENRWVDEELPWNYRDILKKYLNPDYKLLDMGTGGGEFLIIIESSLQQYICYRNVGA